jgi:hypothetical protein
LALDIVGRSLDEVIFGPPPGNINKVEGYMVNRANEMISKPGVTITPAKLHSVLGSALTRAWLIAGEKDFYLFSKDGETLQCQPKIHSPDFGTNVDAYHHQQHSRRQRNQNY